MEISVTAYTDAANVAEYVRKYGFTEEERHRRRSEILKGLVQTEARNSFADYGAYEIYANQEQIQKRIIESLRPQLAGQLLLVTESVQIGNPDFIDDRIEAAAPASSPTRSRSRPRRRGSKRPRSPRRPAIGADLRQPALLDIKSWSSTRIERARADGIRSHQGA